MSQVSHTTNGIDEAFVERLVREVMRRLQSSEASTHPETPRVCELHIDDRVITLETIRQCGAEIESLVVTEKAIVTPAVIDELRDRGITLARQGRVVSPSRDSRIAAGRSAKSLTIARVDNADGPGWKAVSQIGHATVNGGLSSVVARLKNQISGSGGQGRAVMVTSAPAVAVFTACQNGLRAAYASSMRDVGHADRQFQANLLVVDSHVSPCGALDAFAAERK